MLFNKSPNYSYLRVFGYLCYATTLPHNKHKFAPRFIQCIMFGYPQGIKGYRLLNLSTRQIFVSRDVIFYENSFPFQKSQPSILAPPTVTSLVLPHLITDTPTAMSPISFDGDSSALSLSDHNSSTLSDHTSPSLHNNPSHSPLHCTHQSPTSAVLILMSNPTNPIPENMVPSHHSIVPAIRKSTRTHKTPSYLQEFHCNNASLSTASHSSPTTDQGTTSTNFPLSNFLSYSNLALCYHSFVLNASTIRELTSFQEASQDLKWCEAMQAELAALEANNTWSIQTLPPSKVPIGSKWVF